MKFTIQKAKIVKGETVEVSYERIDDKNEKSHVNNETFDSPFHLDLLESFKVMGIHLAIMSGYVKANDISNNMGIINVSEYQKAESFNVTSFSYGGNNDKEGIVLSGSNKLDNGKAQILNSPFYRFEENQDSRYIFMDDLIEKLDRCDKELMAYMDGSKRATDPQQSLFDENTPVINKLQILPPEKQNAIIPADSEAMKRVKEGFEKAEIVPEKKGKPGRKKVAQSAENPSGIVGE